MRTRLLILMLTIVAFVAACGMPVALRTAPAPVDACEDALLAGELVTSAQSGLAIRNAADVTEVLWPYGYSAAREVDGVVLRDPAGEVVARVGDRVQMGGGFGAGGVWGACAGSIRAMSNEGG